MNMYNILVATFGVLAMLLSATTGSTVPVFYCQPNAMSEVPPKIRQLCIALMERVDAPQEEANEGLGEAMDTQLYGRGTKRQDVDHVFLRFGRRLGL